MVFSWIFFFILQLLVVTLNFVRTLLELYRNFWVLFRFHNEITTIKAQTIYLIWLLEHYCKSCWKFYKNQFVLYKTDGLFVESYFLEWVIQTFDMKLHVMLWAYKIFYYHFITRSFHFIIQWQSCFSTPCSLSCRPLVSHKHKWQVWINKSLNTLNFYIYMTGRVFCVQETYL